jgi:hypothetical protein
MKKSVKQSKRVFLVKRVRGGVSASSSLRAGSKEVQHFTVKLTNA